jgi:hypothetical protein
VVTTKEGGIEVALFRRRRPVARGEPVVEREHVVHERRTGILTAITSAIGWIVLIVVAAIVVLIILL